MANLSLSDRLKQDRHLFYVLTKPSLYFSLLKGIISKIRQAFYPLIQEKKWFVNSMNLWKYRNNKQIIIGIEKNKDLTITSESLKNVPSLDLTYQIQNIDFDTLKIRLASCEIVFESDFFEQKFEDQEDIFSANRFIWIYELLIKYPSKQVISQIAEKILFWINKNTLPKNNAVFEPYSISERLIAWNFFLMWSKKENFSDTFFDKIADSMSKQILFLCQNLEFRGDFTNNHILNNARCLYMVGQTTQNFVLSELAEIIYLQEFPKVFHEGEMLDCSSHYQHLLTKNWLEVVLIAQLTNDKKRLLFLEEKTSKMLFISQFLQTKCEQAEQYPLFGDISPDVHPKWFMGFPFTESPERLSDWHILLGKFLNPNIKQYVTIPKNWVYKKFGSFEVWITLRSCQMQGHHHNDNGNMVVFYQGKELIVDAGLNNYLINSENYMQIDAFAHNVPIINGFSPDLHRFSLIKDAPIYSLGQVLTQNSDKIVYQINYISKNSWTRTLKFDNKKIFIEDSIESTTKKGNFETNFLLGGQAKKMQFKISENVNYSEKEQMINISYGEQKKVNYLKIMNDFQKKITYSVTFELSI